MSDASVFRTRPILVVEDSDEDFDTVVVAARRGQVRNRLVQARSADEARGFLAAHAVNPFAFVLLDCSLPGEDGLSLLHDLRGGATNALLPVVVFTASVNPRDRDAFYAAGANAYHVKKVGFEDCLTSLQQIFRYWLSDATLPDPAALVALQRRAP